MSTVNLVSGAVPFYDDLAGSTNQWNDGSDATWASARSYQNAFGNNRNANAGTVLQRFTAADASTITGVTLSMRMAVTAAPAEAGSPVPVSYSWAPSTSLYPSPRPNGYFDVPVDSTPHDYTVAVTDPTLIAALAAEGVTLSIGFHVADFGGVDHGASLPTPSGYTYRVEVYEVSVVVTYGEAPPPTGTAHAPPLRLFPRSDGRGASSAARVWPRPPTGTYGRVGPGSLV